MGNDNISARGLQLNKFVKKWEGRGYNSVGRQTDRHAADKGSTSRCGKGVFLESPFNADSLTMFVHPPCASACINMCAHVNNPVVHVRVRWIMAALKHQVCVLDWVARLSRSWISSGIATRLSYGKNPCGTIQLLKRKAC